MNIVRRTSAILLLMLVLISSTSFMIGMHFCGGELQKVALFDKADGCEQEKQLPPCHRHEAPACCQDSSIVHDGDEFQSAQTQFSTSPTFVFEMAQPPVVVSEIISLREVSTPRYFNYDPPLRAPDLTVTLQVFLI
ncbi:MAG TPA: hypothetical protein VF473_07740 [Cyclobacteriaceae bacterium]